MISQAKADRQAKGVRVRVGTICHWLGISRQGYYQGEKRRHQAALMEEAIAEQVRLIRQRHPRMGGRKIRHKLQPWLVAQGYKIGRDRFFVLLARQGLLVEPQRRKTRTTWAGHWRCENLLASATLTGPHQAWVSDITYLDTEQGFCYLTLITDAFSRYIVGYNVSDTLTTAGALAALQQAFDQRPAAAKTTRLIHHSDRGVQFTDHRFRDYLRQHDAQPSMGAKGDCYDNALAERMNGILKSEYGLGYRFSTLHQVRQALHEAVWLYNHDRPHLTLNFQTPADVHGLH